jgi:hypothetical protein
MKTKLTAQRPTFNAASSAFHSQRPVIRNEVACRAVALCQDREESLAS